MNFGISAFLLTSQFTKYPPFVAMVSNGTSTIINNFNHKGIRLSLPPYNSLTNGYNGYLPPPEHHKLCGYETWRAVSSYLEVDAYTKITTILFRLLHKFKIEHP